ncbi:MAG TPA: M20/M25/M40 family metallo-hydrolase [Candidatus Gastranaerophilales bacterium]|nr:M20/M25/M40 family metallo-hydrolase [Candidatus Gastranaerophilales bacterium]
MEIKDLRAKYKLIDLFLELCEIPSPPLKEEKVSEKILSVFRKNNISAEYDEYKNIIAKIPGTKRCESLQPLLLSAHMDVVGGSEEVITRISADEKYIETDKTRTLGADNKAGVAAILDLAINLACPENKIEHAPLEIIFTRDEEKGMTGIRNLDASKLKSKYAIIADGENLGELDNQGAGFTDVYIKIHQGKGGHSGINIHEKDRISAIKVLSELDSMIPQGVYKYNSQNEVITSINAGVCIGGTADTCLSEIIKEVYEAGKTK